VSVELTYSQVRNNALYQYGLRTPEKLMDERLGHQDGSIQARYTHVTPEMRSEPMDGLAALWQEALTTRATFRPTSPILTLNRLLCDLPRIALGPELAILWST
jgi:hypothetical protein